MVNPASSAVPASANGERRARMIPASTVDAAMKTMDSYAFDHGACPAIYQRIPIPIICNANPKISTAQAIRITHFIGKFGFITWTKAKISSTSPSVR